MYRTRVTAITFAAALAALSFADPGTVLAAGPEDSVNSLHETLLGTMKEGRTLGESGRYARIKPVVRRVFDIPAMARIAVGASWATLSPAQQHELTMAYGAYISATYADRFDSYTGQNLEITGQQPSASGVIVKARIIKTGGEPISLDYVMRQSDGGWRISDVYLDGAISQLATQRSEFGGIVRRDGFDGLIAALQRKVNMLTGTLARAS